MMHINDYVKITRGPPTMETLFCDPGGIQTLDFQNRNLTFYSAELRGRKQYTKLQI